MHAIAGLLVVLAFSTQAVLCFFNNVSFSTPEQCGPFIVNFSGANTLPVLPLSLTIVPVSSNPITLLLPSSSWNNESNIGAADVTFLPFKAGTQFVASLDDGTGSSVGLVSDIIAVKDSNVTSCLPPQSKGTNFYDMHGDLTQCSRFNVTFDPSVIRNVPIIRAFLPRAFSFVVNASESPLRTMTLGHNSSSSNSSDDHSDKSSSKGSHAHNISSKEFVLDVVHGFQTLLSFDDGEGHRESSHLFTAGGTSSSSSGCFKESFQSSSQSPAASSSSQQSQDAGLTRIGKILVGILGTAVVISLAIIFLLLFRRRQHTRKDIEKTSFIFTEDVDMGSSFAGRVRSRISHLTSKRKSYRSYRDEKDGASTYIPTSPIGSLAQPNSWNPEQLQLHKTTSWIAFNKDTGEFAGFVPESSVQSSGPLAKVERPDSMVLPIIEFGHPSPMPPASAHYPTSEPDVPMAAVSRSHSSMSSRFLLGSGYLSTRSSSNGGIYSPNDEFRGSLGSSKSCGSPQAALVRFEQNKHLSRAAALSPHQTYSGYMPSRSSSATLELDDTEIYISSPIHPSLDFPRSISPQSNTDSVKALPALIPRDIPPSVSRPRAFMSSLRREEPRKDQGRPNPFTASLRWSRVSQI